jgi:hypothetical protein
MTDADTPERQCSVSYVEGNQPSQSLGTPPCYSKTLSLPHFAGLEETCGLLIGNRHLSQRRFALSLMV